MRVSACKRLIPGYGLCGEIASAAEVTAGTDTTRWVTPVYLHLHPSVPKAWAVFDGTTGATLASQALSVAPSNTRGVPPCNTAPDIVTVLENVFAPE